MQAGALYLGQGPLRHGAVSQIEVGLPSVIHGLNPLEHSEEFFVRHESHSTEISLNVGPQILSEPMQVPALASARW